MDNKAVKRQGAVTKKRNGPLSPTLRDLKLTQFVDIVLDYYAKCGRHDLRWRKNITAYKILVSEVMLQQTQVSRVVSKYELWLKHYPTLLSLRQANLREVLILWQGLGYQRRAKALFQVAQEASIIPKVFEELLSLPGVGKYTASAVMAFAYNRFTVPLIETNIRTAVIEHFFKKRERVTDEELKVVLEKVSKMSNVQKVGARNWYYALMDYGAHLKSKSISHNSKVSSYRNQSKFVGSKRELRAKVLFAITHKKLLPDDTRLETVLSELIREGFIKKTTSSYQVV